MYSDLLCVFADRGFLYQCTDFEGLSNLTQNKSIVGYIGFDCTATSLHVGSLMQIMMLLWMEKLGHRPIVLLGDSTSHIGDPSGKLTTRSILATQEIELNLQGIQKVIKQFLPNVPIVYNSNWLEKLGYLEFISQYGCYFSINQMVNYEIVKQRLQGCHHISFLEFNYMLLQAYDFCHLAKYYDCQLQLGGSDQWSNIINGIELGAKLKLLPMFGVTSPLITTHNGKKMGKTESGAVWLSADQLSPFDYWQFWRNVPDQDVVNFLKIFTFLPMSEIQRLSTLQGKEINEAKKILAYEATALCHGIEIAKVVHNQALQLFEYDNLESINHQVVLPIQSNLSLTQILVSLGIAYSLGEAKRQIFNHAIRVNGIQVLDSTLKMDSQLEYQISFGKKKHFLVKFK